MIGALMVDGYGDGLVIECGSEDVDFLRTTGFGLLQVSHYTSMRSHKMDIVMFVRLKTSCSYFPAGMPYAQHQDGICVLPILRSYFV